MATSIYHGNPGSYKTSTATWHEVLPALKLGKIVITNIEGLFSIDQIEQTLKLTFPASSRLYRISTLNQVGQDLLSRWFHWLPVGALLVLDELQNIYDAKDRTEFKALNLDTSLTSVERINALESLPDELKSISLSLLDNINDDGYTDDLGLKERDANGHIIYPQNLKDALMRHRKYNWNIVGCTPDITKVHSLYRSVAEKAVSHRSFDFVPLPWFQRRPRTHEHNALEKGLRPAKGEPVKRRKIPLEAFSLYKSTQTGKNNRSGANENPFKNIGLIIKVGCILSVILGFLFFSLVTRDSDKVSNHQGGLHSIKTANNLITKPSIQAVKENTNATISHDFDKNFSDAPDFLAQIGVSRMDITGYSKSIKFKRIERIPNGIKPIYEQLDYFIFSYALNNDEFTLNSDDLVQMGYIVERVSDCYAKISHLSRVIHSFCAPTSPNEHIETEKPALLVGL